MKKRNLYLILSGVTVILICAYFLTSRKQIVVQPGEPCRKEGVKTTGFWDSGAHWGKSGELSKIKLICSSGKWSLPFAP